MRVNGRILIYIQYLLAGMVKLVDTLDLGSSAERRGGSNPSIRTHQISHNACEGEQRERVSVAYGKRLSLALSLGLVDEGSIPSQKARQWFSDDAYASIINEL